MNALLATLLQLSLSLLSSAQNPSASAELRAQAIATASQAITLYQTARQGQVQVQAQVPKKNIWLNITQLANAEYADLAGNRFQLANGSYAAAANKATLRQEFISFGDLNKDLLDDAVVMLEVSAGTSPAELMLAAVTNRGDGGVADAANLGLGRNVQIFDHRVQNGEFKLDIQADGGRRETRLYKLQGDKLVLVNKI